MRIHERLKRTVVRVTSAVTLLVILSMLVLLLPVLPVQAADSNLTVSFDVIREGPTEVAIRATLTNAGPQPQRGITMTTLLEGLSIPATELNYVKVERVKLETYTVDIPIYGERGLTADEKQEYLNRMETPPATITAIIGYTQETRQREVKEPYRNWSFRGSVPDTKSTTTLPGYNADRDGWGGGVLVLDFTINTGTQVRTDTGGWGSKGVLALDIDGTKYFDLTNSSWWDANWSYRNILSFNMTGISDNFTDYPLIVYINSANNFDFSKISANGTDIRFVDKDDATSLPYLITSWDDVAEEGTAVVRVPQIDANSNYSDYIYIYYGNDGAADGQSSTDTVLGVSDVDIVLNDPLYGLTGTSWTSPDTYGHTNNVTEAVWTSQGRYFDGTNDFINCGQQASLLFSGNMTVEVRINPVNLSASTNQGIVNRGHPYSAPKGWILMSGDGASIQKVGFSGWIGGAWKGSPYVTVDNGVWTQITAIYDGSNLQMFKNGAYVSQTAASGAIDNTAADTKIGYNYGFVVPLYNGLISEVKIYDEALTPTEVETNYLASKWRYDTSNIYYGNEDPPPTLSTLPATNVGMSGGTFATLNGDLESLGGAPSADVWFEWGYDTGYGNIVGSRTVSSTGTYTQAITGYNPTETVYYRFVGQNVDGTTYGAAQTFEVTGGAAVAQKLLYGAGLVVVAGAILVGVFLAFQAAGPVAGLVATVIGLIAFMIVEMWLRSLW